MAMADNPPARLAEVARQLAGFLPSIAICLSIGAAVLKLGFWASDINASLTAQTVALQAETASRIEHDATLDRDLIDRIKQETDVRKAESESAQQFRVQTLATLQRIDRSFQHMFAVTQPQPPKRKE
jgi:hypothetical protein